jgi:hypothetical protein
VTPPSGVAAQTTTQVTGNAFTINFPATTTAGTYTYTVTGVRDNATGCTGAGTNTATVRVLPAFFVTPTTPNTVLCNPGTQTLTLTPNSAAAGTVTYTIQNPNGTTNTLTGVGTAAVTYIVSQGGVYTITAVNGTIPNCGTVTTTTFTQPAPITANLATTNVGCNGANNGSINVTNVQGGTTPFAGAPLYYVSMNGGLSYVPYNPALVPTFSNVGPGVYNIYIMDNNGCVKPIGTASITQAAAVTMSTTVVNTACGSATGSISASTTGGTGGTYTYTLQRPNGTTTTTGGVYTVSYTSLSGGVYTLTSTDGSCSTTTTVTVGAAGSGTPDLVLGSDANTNTFTIPPSNVTVTYNIVNFSNGVANGVVLRVTKPTPNYTINLGPAVGNDNARWTKTTENVSYVEFMLTNDPLGNNYIGCGGSSGVIRVGVIITRTAAATGKGAFSVTAIIRSSVADAYNPDNSTVDQFNAQ